MTDVLATTRCPQCVGLVRPGQQWCTLCHADLRPAPEPVREVLPTAVPLAADAGLEPVAYDPLTDPLTDPIVADGALAAAPAVAPVTVGKHARHAAPGPGEGTPPPADGSGRPGLGEREIEAMIAELAAQTQPPLGGLAGRFDTRGAKVVLAVGVCLGALAFLLVSTVVLTAIFG